MKRLLTLLTILISVNCFGQDQEPFNNFNFDTSYPIINNYCTIERVGECNKNADEIYDRSKEWIVTNFRSAKSVIELDDKINHHIMGKGNFDFKSSFWLDMVQNISFIVDIQTKDNKYRVRFYKIVNTATFKGVEYPSNIESVGENFKHKSTKRSKRFLYEERLKFENLLDNFSDFVNSDAKKDDF